LLVHLLRVVVLAREGAVLFSRARAAVGESDGFGRLEKYHKAVRSMLDEHVEEECSSAHGVELD